MNEHPTPDSPPDNEPKNARTPWVLLLPLALFAGALWMGARAPQTPTDSAPAIATPAPVRPTQVTIFVPDDNGDLRRQSATLSEGLQGREAAIAAVEQAMQNAPDAFPPGAKLLGIVTQGDVAQANFNRAFDNSSFWQGSTRTTIGTYSIVNTLTQNNFGWKRVQFLVEGKPLELLGELDVSDPLTPDTKLVKP
jgi:germination protein M